MTAPTGGVRDRLIDDSIFYCVRDSLDILGWFDSGRRHAPVNLISEPMEDDVEIPLNTIAMDSDSITSDDVEIGSVAQTNMIDIWFDVYGENDAFAKEIAGDIRDILGGLHPEIGRNDSVIDVYDWRMATPDYLFSVQVSNLERQRHHKYAKASGRSQRHWYSVVCMVEEIRGLGDG